MAKILKPYEVTLDPGLAREILNIPIAGMPEGPTPATIGERVAAATRAVEEANAYLAKSKVAALVAEMLMRQLKKRGAASLRVRTDGVVVLHVAYDEEVKPKADPLIKRESKTPPLPKLRELREKAKRLGIDISDLGKKRRAIADRLAGAEEAAAADDEEEPMPPPRLVDEQTESDLEPKRKPKTIRRPRKADGGGDDDLDVADLLDGSAERLR